MKEFEKILRTEPIKLPKGIKVEDLGEPITDLDDINDFDGLIYVQEQGDGDDE